MFPPLLEVPVGQRLRNMTVDREELTLGGQRFGNASATVAAG
jgi:hypothetical protein